MSKLLGPDGKPISSGAAPRIHVPHPVKPSVQSAPPIDPQAKMVVTKKPRGFVDTYDPDLKQIKREMRAHGVRMTENQLKGAVRRSKQATLKSRLKGSDSSLGSIRQAEHQASLAVAKRLTAERKAERLRRREAAK